jgi:hypothetical protein
MSHTIYIGRRVVAWTSSNSKPLSLSISHQATERRDADLLAGERSYYYEIIRKITHCTCCLYCLLSYLKTTCHCTRPPIRWLQWGQLEMNKLLSLSLSLHRYARHHATHRFLSAFTFSRRGSFHFSVILFLNVWLMITFVHDIWQVILLKNYHVPSFYLFYNFFAGITCFIIRDTLSRTSIFHICTKFLDKHMIRRCDQKWTLSNIWNRGILVHKSNCTYI